MRGGPRIAAAALGVALASGLAAAAFASGTGGRSAAALVTLQVAPRGPGSISTSTAGGVDLDNGNAPIGGPCEQNVGEGACHWGFERGTTVTLTANSTGTGFTSWSSPDCPGTGSCTITLNDDLTSIVGIFNPLTLGVRLSSSSGTVTSDPAGIVCSNDGDDGCFHGFPPNTAVRLTVASADFKGWNGACTPADATTCTIVVNDQNTWAGATFGTDDPPSLETTIEVKFQLKKLGSGGGMVTAPNISCGSQCSSQFGYGKTLTLTATPDSTSIFGGWGGVCAQTQLTCTFAVGPITGIKTTFDRDAIPPTTPGDLKVTNTTLTGASIAWTASTDNLGVTGYRVYKDNVSAGDVTGTQFSLDGLACSRTYNVAVDAADAAGNRSQKATVVAATKLCPLAARLAGVSVVHIAGFRTISVQLRVNRVTKARVTLTGNGRQTSAATFRVRPGTNVLRLRVGRLVPAGPYRLRINVIDPDGGSPRVFKRGVLLHRR